MEYFVEKHSTVRQIWGKSDTIVFIFAGASAEFALNKAVDWLYFTGRLPVDPLGRLFSTVSYARAMIFSEKQAALHAMLDVRRLAWDLSLFTTSEFDFVSLPEQYTTGSSIMPNKRNPDVVELLRGQVAVVEGAITEIQAVLSLPSGYHRDLQLTKPALIRGMECVLRCLCIVPSMINDLEFKAEKMAAAISPELYATDIAVDQAASGIPFREANRKAKGQLGQLPSRDPAQSLSKRVSPGACGDLQLPLLRARLEALQT